jgi:hypothetical protein
VSLLGPYLIACSLLVVAGASKLVRPLPTAVVISKALSSSRTRPQSLALAVRLFAVIEIGLGVVAAVFPVPLSAASVAASFAAFGCFVLYVRLKDGVDAGCGCLGVGGSDSEDGSESAPATGFHVFLDLALSGSAATVAAAGLQGSIFSLLSKQRLDGVPLIACCVVGTWLAVLWLAALPRLNAARRIVEQIP